jgi:hypothetical protein
VVYPGCQGQRSSARFSSEQQGRSSTQRLALGVGFANVPALPKRKRNASSRLRTPTLPFSVNGGSNLNSHMLSAAVGTNAKRLIARRRTYSDHVVSRQRPPDPLQRKLADLFDCNGILDRH